MSQISIRMVTLESLTLNFSNGYNVTQLCSARARVATRVAVHSHTARHLVRWACTRAKQISAVAPFGPHKTQPTRFSAE